ncbi:hypothetical protein I204_07381 [Kwoniella mangroviensis CBS 8886]|nr:hypothetical protein I204_07381 [Kwoniella mangroviensis CBS 8886]
MAYPGRDDGEGVSEVRIQLATGESLFGKNRGSKTRLSREEARAKEDPKLMADLREKAVFGQTICLKQAHARLNLYKEYVAIKREKGYTEFDWDEFYEVLEELMKDMVTRSEREEKLEDGTTVLTHITVQTLKKYTRYLDFVLEMEAGHSISMEERDQFYRYVGKFSKALRMEFDLKNNTKQKLAIYSEEIGLMIESVIKHGRHGDVSIQDALFYLMLMHTAGRPSTFIPTRSTNFFLPFKAINIRRRLVQGTMVGFDVQITLENFKGHGFMAPTSKIAKRVIMLLRTVRRRINLPFDFGSTLVAHGLRLGAFGNRTLEDLWNATNIQISWDPLWLEVPVLNAIAAHGYGLEIGAPYRYTSAWARFKDLIFDLGLVAEKGQILGMTSIRKGTANKFKEAFGADVARLLMGHVAGSTTYETSYDETRNTADMTGALLPDEGGIDIERLQPLYKTRINPNTSAEDWASFQAKDLKLTILQQSYAALVKCALEGDSDDWKKLPWFKDDLANLPRDGLEMIQMTNRAIIARRAFLNRQYKKDAAALAARSRSELSAQEMLDQATSYEDGIKSLPDILIASLIRETAEETVTETGRFTALPILISDEPDPDEEEGITEAEKEEIRAMAPEPDDINTAFLELATSKKAYIQALISLPNASDAERTRVPCPKCADDESLTSDKRDATYLPAALRKHQNATHTPIYELNRWIKSVGSCPCCPKTFKQPVNYRDHILSFHTDQFGLTIPINHCRTIIELAAQSTKPYTRGLAEKALEKIRHLIVQPRDKRKFSFFEPEDISAGGKRLKKNEMGYSTRDEAEALRKQGYDLVQDWLS